MSLSDDEGEMVVGGAHMIMIFTGERWKEQAFEIKTEFIVAGLTYSKDMKHLFVMGQDGLLRTIEWRNENNKYPTYLTETSIQEACASRNGCYFALLSKNSEVNIYSYEDCTVVESLVNMEGTYLMNFTADSSSLVCV